MENLSAESRQLLLVLLLMIGEYMLVLLSVIADLWSGIRKARARGEARRSKALRRTIDKLCRYYNALFALTVIDVMQISAAEYLRIACSWDVPLIPAVTLLGSIGIAIIEVKSIFEKADEKQRADAEYAISVIAKAMKSGCLQDFIETNHTDLDTDNSLKNMHQ